MLGKLFKKSKQHRAEKRIKKEHKDVFDAIDRQKKTISSLQADNNQLNSYAASNINTLEDGALKSFLNDTMKQANKGVFDINTFQENAQKITNDANGNTSK